MPPRPRPPRVAPTGMLPSRPSRAWWELSASALGHLLVLLLIVTLLRSPTADEKREPAEGEQRPQPTQQLPLYVPPPPKQQQQPSPPQPPRIVLPSKPEPSTQSAPPATPLPKEERPNAPPEDPKKNGIREPDDASRAPSAPEKAAPKPTTPLPALTPRPPLASAQAAPTQESEAKRLFGQTRRADATDDPITVRPFAVGPDGRPQKCDPLPRTKRDADGKAPMGVAVGRILRDDGSPLSGALLQMVGTQYVAFTDEAGEYRFTYDMTMIEDCRTQYVRVSAKGYESRLLVLVIGDRVRSDDVELRRNSRLPIGIRPGG